MGSVVTKCSARPTPLPTYTSLAKTQATSSDHWTKHWTICTIQLPILPRACLKIKSCLFFPHFLDKKIRERCFVYCKGQRRTFWFTTVLFNANQFFKVPLNPLQLVKEQNGSPQSGDRSSNQSGDDRGGWAEGQHDYPLHEQATHTRYKRRFFS